MSASSLMSLGMKAMAANYAGLQVTGHNIANANVKGYSRQLVEMQTAQGQFTGSGFFGRGVDVATVSRAHDEFLTKEAATTGSLAAMDAKRLEHLQRLEQLFRSGEAGLGYSAGAFVNAMADVANQPADGATRATALARAGDFAQRITSAAEELDSIQQSVSSSIRNAVAEVNALAKGIALANQRIAEVKGLGQPANDLLDERDRMVAKLSEHVRVTRIDNADGSVGLFVGGGQRLVLGTQADRLIAVPDAADPSRMAIAIGEGDKRRVMGPEALGGGGIAGSMQFQGQDLVTARNEIGRYAAAVGHAVNEQQLLGLNMHTPYGSIPTQPMFAIGPPVALANANNARDAGGNPVTPVSLSVVDARALEPSDYDLRPTEGAPAGTYTLTRLSDGTATSVTSGDVVDGMRITIGPPNAAPSDKFLLQPVGRASVGFAKLLDNPRDLAAASPLVADTDPANQGTAVIASFGVNQSPLPVPGATARIQFSDNNGNYTWQLLDSSNAVVGAGAGTWTPGGQIPASGDINGFSMRLSGVPRTGDIITAVPTPASAMATNNGNALAMLGLRDAAIVGGRDMAAAYGESLAQIGVRVQAAESSSEITNAVARQAEDARSSKAGVNLDEEAARLIQYQQGYQAAARVMQTAQSLFDALVQIAGR
ncbi:MAG: flagellar hook-associated protein FlgK [Rubrivivax sp.]|nr:flagellar hook-associated protein FlgK [Rubrivivax sp.]